MPPRPPSDQGVPLRRELRLPPPLSCEELAGSVHEVRLWMSGGNTTSSLHFDTHDNLMVQLDGTKEIYMWHPRESHHFYSDFHTKFCLLYTSPSPRD